MSLYIDKLDQKKIDDIKKIEKSWTKNKEKLLKYWLEECKIYSWLHECDINYYQSLDKYLSFPVFLINAISSTTIISNFDDTSNRQQYLLMMAGILIIIGTFLQSMRDFMNIGNIIHRNINSSKDYKSIVNDIEEQLIQDKKDREHAKIFIQKIKNRKNEIITNGIKIREKSWIKLKKSIENGDIIDIRKSDVFARYLTYGNDKNKDNESNSSNSSNQLYSVDNKLNSQNNRLSVGDILTDVNKNKSDYNDEQYNEKNVIPKRSLSENNIIDKYCDRKDTIINIEPLYQTQKLSSKSQSYKDAINNNLYNNKMYNDDNEYTNNQERRYTRTYNKEDLNYDNNYDREELKYGDGDSDNNNNNNNNNIYDVDNDKYDNLVSDDDDITYLLHSSPLTSKLKKKLNNNNNINDEIEENKKQLKFYQNN